jgi:hypothetical protein
MNASAAIADSLLRLKIDGKKPPRRDVIERGVTSKLGLAGRLAPRTLNILFQVCLGSSGLRVPVSLCDCAISRRTVMNNAG